MELRAEVRVALVGGTPLIQAGVAAVLAQDDRFRPVLRVADVPSALDVFRQSRCDVVVLNTDAPRVDVAALLHGLAAQRHAGTAPRIVALTDEDRHDEALATLQGGAHGYGIRQELWPEDICAAVLAVGRGLTWTCPIVTRRLIELATHAAHQVSPRRVDEQRGESPGGGPSAREADVLRLAATGASDDRIASTLYLSPNSVKTYWQRIRVKLGAHTREEAIRLAVTRGLIPDRRQQLRS